MPRHRRLSGEEVVGVFRLFGFVQEGQRGSHIKLRRLVGGARQTLTIPNHKEIDPGTLRAVYRQALRYIPDSELRPHFYTSA